jgi:DNA-binding MarR family transcriptional regulator
MANEEQIVDWELRLGFLIHDVSRLRRSAFDRCLKPWNVTRSQWVVIAFLSREDGMPQSRLAENLDLGKVAIGGLIDRLERSGMVRREADLNDRRVNRVYLEPKGKKLVSRMRQMSHTLNQQIHGELAFEQLEGTALTLETMKHNLLGFLQSSEELV